MTREEAETEVREFLNTMRLLGTNPKLQTALEVLCDDARGLPRVAEERCECGHGMGRHARMAGCLVMGAEHGQVCECGRKP